MASVTVHYSTQASPQKALLGETIAFTLACAATGDAPATATFGHGSLSLELAREGSGREPSHAFPNRRVIHEQGRLFREQSSDDPEALHKGDERRRAFTSREVFVLQLLDVGRFSFTYSVAAGERLIGADPVTVQIESGPASVPLLFARLEDGELSTRTRVAALLRRMTGQGLDYDPAAGEASRKATAASWRAGWDQAGRNLPWDYGSDGTRTGAAPLEPPPGEKRSGRLGGVVTPAATLGQGRAHLLAAIAAWTKTPSPSALRGHARIADATITYPPPPARVQSDDELAAAWTDVLDRLEPLARAGAAHVDEALIILRTIAEMPSPKLLPPLKRLTYAAVRSPAWHPVGAAARALIDVIALEPPPR